MERGLEAGPWKVGSRRHLQPQYVASSHPFHLLREPGRKATPFLHFLLILAAICLCLGPSKLCPTKDTLPSPSDDSDDGCPEDGPIADLIALEKATEEICFLSTLWPHPVHPLPPFPLPPYVALQDSPSVPRSTIQQL